MLSDKKDVAANVGETYSLSAEVAESLRVAPISYEGGLVPMSVLGACLDDPIEQELQKNYGSASGGMRVTDVILHLEMIRVRQMRGEPAAQTIGVQSKDLVMPWMAAPAL